jgi:predicted GIY-YIG superfamily endonuclease
MKIAVYAIRASNGRIYIGQSQNAELRLNSHNNGGVSSTKEDCPWVLVKTEFFETREKARFFEWQLKRSKGKRDKWLKVK